MSQNERCRELVRSARSVLRNMQLERPQIDLAETDVILASADEAAISGYDRRCAAYVITALTLALAEPT